MNEATSSAAVPSLQRCLLTGSLGFCLASLCVFATVAFAERWMYRNLGLAASYLVWTALFILLGGSVLGSVVVGRWRLPKFYLLFAAAFFAYAVGWTAAYFLLQDVAGEWVGSLAGSFFMGLAFALGFGRVRSAISASLILFVLNSAGYFIGSTFNSLIRGPGGMLTWGAIYGLLLGAGIGIVLHLLQVPTAEQMSSTNR